MLGLIPNDIDDVVDGNAANDVILIVHDRCGEQIAILEFSYNLL